MPTEPQLPRPPRFNPLNPKEQFIYHAAGLRGMGDSSYIDSVVLRDRDANSGWTSVSDGTLEERIYYCQNWRGDVVCLTDSSGDPQEWIRYSAYGVPFCIPKGDYNCDGVLDSNDHSELESMVAGSYGFWKDFLSDGSVDQGDIDALDAYIIANSGAPGGRGKLSRGDGTTSSSALGNRIGYAGYQFDPALSGSVWHVRNRVLVSELGRWTRRDPIGYVENMSLYVYLDGEPLTDTDPSGEVSAVACGRWAQTMAATRSGVHGACLKFLIGDLTACCTAGGGAIYVSKKCVNDAFKRAAQCQTLAIQYQGRRACYNGCMKAALGPVRGFSAGCSASLGRLATCITTNCVWPPIWGTINCPACLFLYGAVDTACSIEEQIAYNQADSECRYFCNYNN